MISDIALIRLSTPPARIYVVEPQNLLAGAICAAIGDEPGFELAGCSPVLHVGALVEAAAEMLLIDFDADLCSMPARLSECRQYAPTVRTCVFSEHMSSDVMLHALASGADGFILKDVNRDQLLASIRTLRVEGFYADHRLSNNMLRRRIRRDIMQLSPREVEIVQHLVHGLTNKQIAVRLRVSDKTVKNHLSNIFGKLQMANRAQVVAYALRSGLA